MSIVNKTKPDNLTSENIQTISDLTVRHNLLMSFQKCDPKEISPYWTLRETEEGYAELMFGGSETAKLTVTPKAYLIDIIWQSGDRYTKSWDWDSYWFSLELQYTTYRLIKENKAKNFGLPVKDLIRLLNRFSGDDLVYVEVLREDETGMFHNTAKPVLSVFKLDSEANHIETEPDLDRSKIVILQ